MKVINVHSRVLNQPMKKLGELFAGLATKEDQIWPRDKWPAMRFKNGLALGERGGHGPIRYVVEAFSPGAYIQFRFLHPKGFEGIHTFEIHPVTASSTEVRHTIEMNTVGLGTLMWLVAIRALHDALLEDALDNIENHFSGGHKKTEWSAWVKLLRIILG